MLRFLCLFNISFSSLPLNVSEKIYNAFDVPALLIEVLLKKPWLKNNKQYAGGRWLPWDGVTLIKQEAQVNLFSIQPEVQE